MHNVDEKCLEVIDCRFSLKTCLFLLKVLSAYPL